MKNSQYKICKPFTLQTYACGVITSSLCFPCYVRLSDCTVFIGSGFIALMFAVLLVGGYLQIYPSLCNCLYNSAAYKPYRYNRQFAPAHATAQQCRAACGSIHKPCGLIALNGATRATCPCYWINWLLKNSRHTAQRVEQTRQGSKALLVAVFCYHVSNYTHDGGGGQATKTIFHILCIS